jgi:hypothetical protein
VSTYSWLMASTVLLLDFREMNQKIKFQFPATKRGMY